MPVPMNDARVMAAVEVLLAEVGEDPTREGLARTPARVTEALKFLTSGYAQDIDEVLNNALFNVDYSEMVIVKDIDFYSLCEHHLLPFFGKCHVAYLPRKRVVGLSKVPRIVDVFSRRLQIQERLTNQIAEVISEKLDPLGVGCGCRRDASLHADARGRETERVRTDQRHARLVSVRRADPDGVPGASQAARRPCVPSSIPLPSRTPCTRV